MGIVALNLATNTAVIDVPVAGTSWNQERVKAAREALEQGSAYSSHRALLQAGDWAAGVMISGVAPRTADEVVDEGLSRNAVWLALVGLVGVAVGLAALWRWHSRRPRICRACGRPRELLSEVAEDAHLDDAQRLEEQWGAADYHVWRCGYCRDVEIIKNTAWLTRLKPCPKCGQQALKVSAKMISWPTIDSPGEIELDELCAQCGYTAAHPKGLPKLSKGAGGSKPRALSPAAAHFEEHLR